MNAVNKALNGNDAVATLRALQNPRLNLPALLPNAQSLYHEELRSIKTDKQVLELYVVMLAGYIGT